METDIINEQQDLKAKIQTVKTPEQYEKIITSLRKEKKKMIAAYNRQSSIRCRERNKAEILHLLLGWESNKKDHMKNKLILMLYERIDKAVMMIEDEEDPRKIERVLSSESDFWDWYERYTGNNEETS